MPTADTPKVPKLQEPPAPKLDEPKLDAPKPEKPKAPEPLKTPEVSKAPKTPGLKMDPMAHQSRVHSKLEAPDTAGQIAVHGLGTGKTFTAINAAHEMKAPLLAVVPASLRNNMRKGIAQSGFSQPYKVVSYEEAVKNLDNPEFRNFAENAIVAYDEAHRMGQSGSQRSNLPGNLPGKKKLLLTGTPIRNQPAEIAPLVNAIEPGALPDDPKAFNKKFIETREVPVGFWGRLRGAKPGKEHRPINLHEFEKAVSGKVDYHENVDRSTFPSFSESIVEVPMSDKQQSTYHFVMGKYPALAYKIRHGLPLNKTESKNFKAFMIGPRQVSNAPSAYNKGATDAHAAKVNKMVDEVEQRHSKDKNYRGVTYSSFLDSGVRPLSRELKRRGIPHAIFTGEQGDEERKQIIDNYNSGKVPHLIISGAGAEGLDLKGTKLMQVTEPHWNEELIDQVRGRAIRFKSHSHLPDDQRHVEVQRYHSVPQPGWLDKLFRRPQAKQKAVDQFIYEQALSKRKVNEPFLNILKGMPAAEAARQADNYYSKAAEYVPVLTAVDRAREKAEKFASVLYSSGDTKVAAQIHALAEPAPDLN